VLASPVVGLLREVLLRVLKIAAFVALGVGLASLAVEFGSKVILVNTALKMAFISLALVVLLAP